LVEVQLRVMEVWAATGVIEAGATGVVIQELWEAKEELAE
jgi:hypothetical protein